MLLRARRYDAYFEAVVQAFDPLRKMHACVHLGPPGLAAGERQWHDLSRKRVEVLAREPPARPAPGPAAGAGAEAQVPRGSSSAPASAVEGSAEGGAVPAAPAPRMPPSIFGLRPLSAPRSARPVSATRPLTEAEVAALRASPYNSDAR